MLDLSIKFCGFKLKNPFILSSAPPTGTGGMIKDAFDAGWAGAVTKTLVPSGTEMRNVSPRLNALAFEGFEGEPKNIFAMQNIELVTDRPLETWLEEIREITAEYPDHMLIASIMAEGKDKEAWRTLAVAVQEAGAHAIELNFSCPHGGMPGESVGSAIGQDPDFSAEITGWVKEVATIPVLVKLTPNITDITVIARRVKESGADGISAINTVLAISGIDLDTFAPLPTVDGKSAAGGLSGPAIKPIALRMVAELSTVGLPISGIGGVSEWRDAAEFILLGAETVQVCTSVMLHGVKVIEDFTEGLLAYLEEKELPSVDALRGKSLAALADLMDLDTEKRAVSAVDEELCIKCDICYISCRDGGHQAIALTSERLPVIDVDKCDGCAICVQVCPVWDCMRMVAVET